MNIELVIYDGNMFTTNTTKQAISKYGAATTMELWNIKIEILQRLIALQKNNADEFDFSNKWAESIGQALHYQKMTGKKGKVVLILENPKKEMIYFKRVEALAKIYDFDAEYITPKILNLDKNNKCKNPNCKCHKERVIKLHDWRAFIRWLLLWKRIFVLYLRSFLPVILHKNCQFLKCLQ